MMIISVQQLLNAMRLNTSARIHRNCRKLDDASIELAKALKASKGASQPRSDNDIEDNRHLFGPIYTRISNEENLTAHDYQTFEHQDPKGPSFVFARPIHIAVDIEDPNDYELSVVVSGVIIFNLALVHHIIAVGKNDAEFRESFHHGHYQQFRYELSCA